MKTCELLLWLLGTTLISVYLGGHHHGEQLSRQSLGAFTEGQALIPSGWMIEPQAGEPDASGPDTDPEEPPPADTVIAVLRIPGVGLEVPVFLGTTEYVLRRGAGLVEGTAFPGSTGNVGIAAHRDSHFRSLKDVAVGDLIELGTPNQVLVYRITELQVVNPRDIHVLDDTGEAVLTLVTCYPFNFIGSAPQRYIVRAVVASVLI